MTLHVLWTSCKQRQRGFLQEGHCDVCTQAATVPRAAAGAESRDTVTEQARLDFGDLSEKDLHEPAPPIEEPDTQPLLIFEDDGNPNVD
jgi:hypothetical protein